MEWWEICQNSIIEYFYIKKEVIIIYAKKQNNCDFFFCCFKQDNLIFSSGCRSPPNFNFKF